MSNLALLKAIARQITPLLSDVVFVGGATTELFLTSPVSGRVRVTRDVDVLCEVAGRIEYHRLGERLRACGFQEDMTPGAPLCRWRSDAGVLDVMPTDARILGFTNPWYAYGIATARGQGLEDDLVIHVVSPTVFLATKLAAYEGRGAGDLIRSHDIEDVISVVAFRPELVSELEGEEPGLRKWVSQRIRQHLIEHPEAETAIVGNLPDARLAPALISSTMSRLNEMADLRHR